MKKIKNLLIIAFTGFILSSCVSAAFPTFITDNPTGTKRGVARADCILGICFNMDLGVERAAKNGKITRVSTVDYKIESGMFKKTYMIIVTGE